MVVHKVASKQCHTSLSHVQQALLCAGMSGFEMLLHNTSLLYTLLVVYTFVQAVALILMLCSFIQRW